MKVVHCKKEPYDVYIGRPSFWGNQFTIGKDGTREEVVQKYKEHLERVLFLNPEVKEKLVRELKGKVLGCWCAPLSCHGDILMELANR